MRSHTLPNPARLIRSSCHCSAAHLYSANYLVLRYHAKEIALSRHSKDGVGGYLSSQAKLSMVSHHVFSRRTAGDGWITKGQKRGHGYRLPLGFLSFEQKVECACHQAHTLAGFKKRLTRCLEQDDIPCREKPGTNCPGSNGIGAVVMDKAPFAIKCHLLPMFLVPRPSNLVH